MNLLYSLVLKCRGLKLLIVSVLLKCFNCSRAKAKKAEDETVRRRSMRLQRVEPSAIPMPKMPAQPEAEEYVRWGTVKGAVYTQKLYKNSAGS